jgi:hypothetical protein
MCTFFVIHMRRVSQALKIIHLTEIYNYPFELAPYSTALPHQNQAYFCLIYAYFFARASTIRCSLGRIGVLAQCH